MNRRLIKLLTILCMVFFCVSTVEGKRRRRKSHSKRRRSKRRSYSKYSNRFYNPYRDGSWDLNLGVSPSPSTSYGDTSIPPVSLSIERNTPIGRNKLPFSFGAYVGYASTSFTRVVTSTYQYKYDYSYMWFGGRATFHFNKWLKVNNLDSYAGLLLGYTLVNATFSETGTTTTGVTTSAAGSSYLLIGGLLGVRYFFTKRFGVFLEAGYGVGYVTGGVTFKIN